ncbi:universal stress protein family protein [Pontibacter ummariensis]|uniref:Universal stress protein family protein n=2 Tax=Pontibacter ummariensis TaxID=1610492 RepID=A0A239FNG0_9BACT|nr:universal stress protein family protein [Pontibacter ummariensis]SNS57474.1 Universal stress protein family protein [Pontibacter ummariensis]
MSKANNVKRVLVPIQFDQESERLLRYAGFFAKALGAELLLLHVTQTAELTYTQQYRAIQALRMLAERALQQLSGNAFLQFECAVRPGSLKSSIKTVVQDYGVDLVLMQPCPTPAEEQAKDSHAATVMGLLECPVLVAPATMQFRDLKHLVFGTDFTDRDPQVIKRIASFAGQAGARLTLVQVYSKEDRSQLCNLKSAMKEVETLLQGRNVDLLLLEEEDTLEGISEFSEKAAADMLVMATRDSYLMERLFSKAYVKTLAYHTRIPLLTFRQHKKKPCSGCCANCQKKAAVQQTIDAIQIIGTQA